MLRCFFCNLFLLLSLCCFTQTATTNEQLKTKIFSAKNSKEKLQAVLAFCDQWESYSPDTLKKYAHEAKRLAQQQKDAHSEILADYYNDVWLLQANKIDSGLTLSNEIINRYKKQFSYDAMLPKMYALKGNFLLRNSKFDDLMAIDYELIQLGEQHKDTIAMSRGTLGLGNVSMKLMKYNEALLWYHKALGLMQNPFYKRKLSLIFNNIGITFYHLQKEDSALYYVRQGIEYSKEDQNLTNLANAYFLYGGILAEFHHLNEAEESFKQAIEVRKKIGDIYYLISDMSQLALFYADNKQPDKGIELCKEGLALAEKNGNSSPNLLDLYEQLAHNYYIKGDYKNYGDALYKESALKDSIYKKNSAEALAEIQTKYDLQKKENTIIQQKLELVSKNYQLYGSLTLLLLAIVASFIILKQYRRRQELKLQLVHEEEKRKSEKAVADAEEAERKRIAADLHDSLGAYAASITSNIEHLHLTQKDSSNFAALKELRNNSMAIVSQLSDTIWALKKDALSLTMISDRIKIFVQRIQPSYPNVVIDIFEAISTDHLLAPSQAFHLFQIIKEAINNALRHSRCSYLSITINGNENWKIKIADNGQGLQEVTITKGGNGLLNMKSRAKESGWKIEWQNIQPKGTQVVIEPTTN